MVVVILAAMALTITPALAAPAAGKQHPHGHGWGVVRHNLRTPGSVPSPAAPPGRRGIEDEPQLFGRSSHDHHETPERRDIENELQFVRRGRGALPAAAPPPGTVPSDMMGTTPPGPMSRRDIEDESQLFSRSHDHHETPERRDIEDEMQFVRRGPMGPFPPPGMVPPGPMGAASLMGTPPPGSMRRRDIEDGSRLLRRSHDHHDHHDTPERRGIEDEPQFVRRGPMGPLPPGMFPPGPMGAAGPMGTPPPGSMRRRDIQDESQLFRRVVIPPALGGAAAPGTMSRRDIEDESQLFSRAPNGHDHSDGHHGHSEGHHDHHDSSDHHHSPERRDIGGYPSLSGRDEVEDGSQLFSRSVDPGYLFGREIEELD